MQSQTGSMLLTNKGSKRGEGGSGRGAEGVKAPPTMGAEGTLKRDRSFERRPGRGDFNSQGRRVGMAHPKSE